MTPAPLISIKGLRKSFGANVVLKDISLDVARGEVVAIIGPSGSGKSTVADQVIFMREGVVAESGPPATVIDHPREEATRQFLGRFKAAGGVAPTAAPTAAETGEV